MQAIIRRQEAIEQGLINYFTGKACKYGHVAKRNTKQGQCCQCRFEYVKRFHQDNPKNNAKYVSRYQQRHPERVKVARQRRYREYVDKYGPQPLRTTKEKRAETCRKYSRNNRDHLRECNRIWRENNPEKSALKNLRYRLRKLKSIPDWLSLEHKAQIKTFYLKAKKKAVGVGGSWHVDHIIPLKGKLVCGLHVPWNLRVIAATENLRKNNKVIL